MFRFLIEELRVEASRPDIKKSKIWPLLKRNADRATADMVHSGNYSRSKLRKWGIIPNPYKRKSNPKAGDGS